MKRNTSHQFLFLTVIRFRLWKTLRKQRNKQPLKNLRLKLNLLRCYHTSKGYQRLFAVAYNSKAYGQFSDLTQHLQQCNATGHYPLWDEVKFIDRHPHWYTRRVKEAIHIRLHPDNINRDNGIEIPEAWMPTIKQHSSRSVPRRTAEGTIF